MVQILPPLLFKMEDELVNEKGRYEFSVFLPNENTPLSCDVNEQFGFYMVNTNEEDSEKPNSLVSKFREILRNPESCQDRIMVEWYKRDGENFNPPEIEYLTSKDLRFMAPHFEVRDYSSRVEINQFNSEGDLREFLEETFGEKPPKYLS